MKQIKFEHHTGMEAYLWLFLHHDMQIKINSIVAIDRNLEVLIADGIGILAFRSDLPEDMRHMVRNASKWCLTEDIDMLSKSDRCRLELLMMEYRWN